MSNLTCLNILNIYHWIILFRIKFLSCLNNLKYLIYIYIYIYIFIYIYINITPFHLYHKTVKRMYSSIIELSSQTFRTEIIQPSPSKDYLVFNLVITVLFSLAYVGPLKPLNTCILQQLDILYTCVHAGLSGLFLSPGKESRTLTCLPLCGYVDYPI